MTDRANKHTRRISRRRFLRRAVFGTLGAGIVASGYTRFLEPWWVDQSHVRIAIANLPDALAGLRIAHLTDIHYQSCSLDEVADWVAMTNARRPDLICMTGDYISGHPKWAGELTGVLRDLSAPLGVVACLGNHDYGRAFPLSDPDHQAVGRQTRKLLEAAGIEVLVDQLTTRDVHGSPLRIAGVGDMWSDDYDTALVRRSDRRPLIVLAHNPDVFYELDRDRFDLMLAGHTHGGQVKLPFIGAIMLPINHRELAEGLHRRDGAQLYTSRGIGYSYPLRFCCRPELPIIELVKE